MACFSEIRIVDRYVVVHETCQQIATKYPKTSAARSVTQTKVGTNPHAARVASEHCYYSDPMSQTCRKRKRRLPQWLRSHEQTPAISTALVQITPDGILNYSSVVLNDGLLLLELRDAIREGDSVRVIRCWKFMLLYWRHAGHTKYCLEAFQLLACVNATAISRIAHEVTWCRFVNSRGGAGNNIPVDLYMEHINRTLKDYLHGLGANIGENTIVQTSKSLRGLTNIADQFDRTSGIHASSIYHTCKSSHKDFKSHSR